MTIIRLGDDFFFRKRREFNGSPETPPPFFLSVD